MAPPDEWSGELEALGARFIPLPMNAAGTNPLAELGLMLRARRLLRAERPDFLFNFTIKMNLYFGLSARMLGIPYANNVSGLGTAFIHDTPVYRAVQRLYGVSNRGARRVFFQNSEDRDLFLARDLAPSQRITLLPGSGVDVQRFAFTPMPDGAGEGALHFLMISRLIGDKGVREFVAAARTVKAQYPECRFTLLGPSGVSNRTAVTDAELSQWREQAIVDLPGEQRDVLPSLQTCHVLVLPSYREGMPRTVLEAAAVGRPAIVTDVPGCRHAVVPDQTGWLCEVRSAESLAERMIQVIESSRRQPEWLAGFGERAAERVRREFDERIVVQAYLGCLGE